MKNKMKFATVMGLKQTGNPKKVIYAKINFRSIKKEQVCYA